MNKQRLSLIDVINPPENPWLEEISQRNAKDLPAGVHVVRSSDDGDLEDQSLSPRSRPPHVSTRQAA